jgi:hypothetical protein
MYASLVFDATVDAGQANYLLRVARGLTYRQLCSLAFFVNPSPSGVLTLLDAAREAGTAQMSEALFVELEDLGQTDVLGFGQESGEVAPPRSTYGGATFRSIDLERIKARPQGELLYRLMRLERVPDADLSLVRVELGADD